MKIKLLILFLIFSRAMSAQSSQAENYIRSGNDFYKQLQFDKAASDYNKAIETNPADNKAKFNLANTLYKQNKQDEALKLISEVADKEQKAELKAKAYYNQGVIFSQQKKLEESIEAYKNALRLNPGDKEARENLQKALLELKKKKQPEKKDEQDKNRKRQDQQPKQPQSRLSSKETEQRLKLLAQKEKEVQQRVQKEKTKPGGSQVKDW
jgi:tetratricopeptide (TPR) repeat protein